MHIGRPGRNGKRATNGTSAETGYGEKMLWWRSCRLWELHLPLEHAVLVRKRSRTIGIAERTFDIYNVDTRYGRSIRSDERLEGRIQIEPRSSRASRRGTLAIEVVGAWIVRELALDGESLRLPMLLLPKPEHAINKAVMEEEDWVEGSSVILTLHNVSQG